MKFIFIIVLIFISKVTSLPNSFKLLSSTAWTIEPETFYTDFSASMTADYRPTVFQYFYQNVPTLFECNSCECTNVTTVSMKGLFKANFALSGVSPRRIQQYSPKVPGAKFFLSKGYATRNRDVELVTCSTEDINCEEPSIQNTADSPGFGQAGIRLTFTRDGLPIMLIPEARFASADNRVTGYIVQSCQDFLCQQSRLSYERLPFNITGKAWCEATSVDVALNRFGYPTWLTKCGTEMNLIHCLTPTCNQTSAISFTVNTDYVYFVYLAVDSKYRFSISTSGQKPTSDITYIRCLDPDCEQFKNYQLTIPLKGESSFKSASFIFAQHVIDPMTDLPVFHCIGNHYPSRLPFYAFIACSDLDCSDMDNIIDYGMILELSTVSVTDVFIDQTGIITSISRAKYQKRNETINLIVRIGRSDMENNRTINWIQI